MKKILIEKFKNEPDVDRYGNSIFFKFMKNIDVQSVRMEVLESEMWKNFKFNLINLSNLSKK